MIFDKSWWFTVLFFIAACLIAGALAHPPKGHSEPPAYCYGTHQWIPWPENSRYCPDGQSPFDGPGPSYGGGNHRWPDGSDD